MTESKETLEEFLVRRFELVPNRLDGIAVTTFEQIIRQANFDCPPSKLYEVASRVWMSSQKARDGDRLVDRVRRGSGTKSAQIRLIRVRMRPPASLEDLTVLYLASDKARFQSVLKGGIFSTLTNLRAKLVEKATKTKIYTPAELVELTLQHIHGTRTKRPRRTNNK